MAPFPWECQTTLCNLTLSAGYTTVPSHFLQAARKREWVVRAFAYVTVGIRQRRIWYSCSAPSETPAICDTETLDSRETYTTAFSPLGALLDLNEMHSMISFLMSSTCCSVNAPEHSFLEKRVSAFAHEAARRAAAVDGCQVLAIVATVEVVEVYPFDDRSRSLEFATMGEEEDEQLAELPCSCSVCLEEFSYRGKEKLQMTPCGHWFHRECIRRWKMQSTACPVCRRRIAVSSSELAWAD